MLLRSLKLYYPFHNVNNSSDFSVTQCYQRTSSLIVENLVGAEERALLTVVRAVLETNGLHVTSSHIRTRKASRKSLIVIKGGRSALGG